MIARDRLCAAALLLCAGPLLRSGPSAQDGAPAAEPGGAVDEPSSTADGLAVLEDAPLDGWRRELLELAFDAACAIPLEPHVKTRCRMQGQVVSACLELDQAALARGYAARVDDWRRGVCQADVAAWCAERGLFEAARQCLSAARDMLEVEPEGFRQEWRRDLVRERISAAQRLLEEAGLALEHGSDPNAELSGELSVTRARLETEVEFEHGIDELNALLAIHGHDETIAALDMCVELYDRHFESEERRAVLAGMARTSVVGLPRERHVELLASLAERSLSHGAVREALGLLGEAREVLASARWLAQDEVPLRARLAALRHRAGEAEAAGHELGAAFTLFDTESEHIADVFRAGALRPLARAYAQVGERDLALGVYRRAVEEGAENPNARPRAEDLVSTCVSMALADVHPTAELLGRLREIRAGLMHPW